MKVHHLRNATLVIESNDKFILVDPMLGKKGTSMPLAFFRFKSLKNPLVEMPPQADAVLAKVTHCLITHLHPDHLDEAGYAFLKERNIPVVCSELERKALEKKGLNIELALKYDEPQTYLGGRIIGVKAIHGYGFITAITGNVMGFHVALPNEPSIFISSDTVYTPEVDHALKTYQPAVTVMAAGMAQLDIGNLLLMNQEDIVKFVQHSPGKVMANHMEALNHCPNKRTDLKALLQKHNLLDKVAIPDDGEVLDY